MRRADKTQSKRTEKTDVPIWIQDERDMPHPPIRQLLLERHAELLEPSTSSLYIGNSDGDVTESARLLVAVVVSDEVGVVLRAVVPGELEHPLSCMDGVFVLLFCECAPRFVVPQENEREFAGFVIPF